MTVHKLNLENIARDAVARFAGQAQAFASKQEIDATPAEIEALRVCFVQAIENWKSDMVDGQPMTKEEIIQWVKDQSVTTEQMVKNARDFAREVNGG